MNRMGLLLQELDISYDQEGWFVPLKNALQGLTPAQALWRPDGRHVNTIWETVAHVVFYKERYLVRMQGGDPGPAVSDNDATFAVSGNDEAAWRDLLARLEAVHQGMREVLSGQPDDAFERPVANTKLGEIMTHLILHDAYHTGQIVQLRKLQSSYPSRS